MSADLGEAAPGAHAPTDPVRAARRLPSWPVLVALFAIAGVAWTLMTPLMGVPDEPAYSVQAAALWSGQLDSSPTPVDATPRTLPYGNGRWFRLPEVWFEGYAAPCFAYVARHPASCETFGTTSGSTDIVDVPDTLPYRVLPVWPALVGWAGRLAPGAVGVYGMRLISALLGAVLLAAAVRALATAVSTRLALVGVLGAVTPTAYAMISSVNPNGLEIAAGVSAWAHALALGRRRASGASTPTSLFVGLAVSAGLLAFTRPLSPFYLAFLLVVAGVSAAPARLGELWADRRAKVTAAVVAAELVVTIGIVAIAERSATGNDPSGPLLRLSRTRLHLTEAIATFSWLDTHVSHLVVPWVLGLLVLGVLALVCARPRTRAALVLVGVAAAGAMTVNNIPGAGGWQGRYALPLFVGVALVAAVGVGERRPGHVRAARWLVPAAGVLFVLTVAAAFARVLQRFGFGLPTSWLSNPLSAEWQPPGGALLSLLLMAAFAVGAIVLVVTADDEAPRVTTDARG